MQGRPAIGEPFKLGCHQESSGLDAEMMVPQKRGSGLVLNSTGTISRLPVLCMLIIRFSI